MQAIQTSYKGPTNTKGSRIIAKCEAGSLTVGYDYALTTEGNHKEAARLLQYKLGWLGHNYGAMVSGCLPSGDYAHVFTGSE